MMRVVVTCVVLWVLVIGAVLVALWKEREWGEKVGLKFPKIRNALLKVQGYFHEQWRVFLIRRDGWIARRGIRKFRRAIIKALKRGDKISVDIDRDHLIDLKKLSKHDLEKLNAMLTANLQMYEAVYGSDLLNKTVHKWPVEQRRKEGK